MKRLKSLLAIVLVVALTICGCGTIQGNSTDINKDEDLKKKCIEIINNADDDVSYNSMGNVELLTDIENTVLYETSIALDEEKYQVENVSTFYISKEYLEELQYNTQKNIYFGYTLAELEEQFQGSKYVFTLGDTGKTAVKNFEGYDDTFEKAIGKIAIGTGIIFVCVTVSVVTAGTAAAPISVVMATSAKTATTMALSSTAIATATSCVVSAVNGDSFDESLKNVVDVGSDAFMWGAIGGAVVGGLQGGIAYNASKAAKEVKFFKDGTAQAAMYNEGIEFTNGYARFEKYAKATVKFDAPTLENVQKGTCLLGKYTHDAKLANIKAGFVETPKGYVWHHVEDMQTMILVPQEVHSVAFGGMAHNGGASLIRKTLAGLIGA